MGMGSNVLKGKIFVFVFGKVQGLGLCGDPLAGVIGKAPAFAIDAYHAPFGTQDHFVIQFAAVGAVGAGTFDFLSE